MLNNFGVVVLHSLYRGGQPDEKGFQDLSALGVNWVFGLNAVDDARVGWGGGLDRNQMSGLESQEEVERIVTLLDDNVDKGRVVYVHCTHGRDRTGLIVAAWRIICRGWTYSRANEERLLYGERWVLELADFELVRTLRQIAVSRGLNA